MSDVTFLHFKKFSFQRNIYLFINTLSNLFALSQFRAAKVSQIKSAFAKRHKMCLICCGTKCYFRSGAKMHLSFSDSSCLQKANHVPRDANFETAQIIGLSHSLDRCGHCSISQTLWLAFIQSFGKEAISNPFKHNLPRLRKANITWLPGIKLLMCR